VKLPATGTDVGAPLGTAAAALLLGFLTLTLTATRRPRPTE